MCCTSMGNGSGCLGTCGRISAGLVGLLVIVHLNFIKACSMKVFVAFALYRAFFKHLRYLSVKSFD